MKNVQRAMRATVLILLLASAAHAEPQRSSQRFGFDLCYTGSHDPQPAPPGGWHNCAVLDAPTMAACEAGLELWLQRNKTQKKDFVVAKKCRELK